MKRNTLGLLALATASLLTACGGGGGYDNPPPQARDPLEVPTAVNTSNAAMVSYLGGLPTESVNDREPVSVDSFAPMQGDADEPIFLGA